MASTGAWEPMEVDISAKDVEYHVTLQQVQPSQVNLFGKTPEKVAESKEESDEFLLEIRSSIPLTKLPWLEKVKDEGIEFLVVLDRSGSMAGGPWRQVQAAMRKLIGTMAGNSKVNLRIVIYNHAADFMPMSVDEEYNRQEINRIRAQGSTSFAAVFEALSKYLEREPVLMEKLHMKPDAEKRKMFVLFMTDGCDTANDKAQLMKAKEKLQTSMEKYGQGVIVHVLGFSESHDDVFLNNLSMMGTADGSYSYVEPQDGPEALEKQLTVLLEATAGLIGKTVFLELKMNNDARFLGDWMGEEEREAVLPGFLRVEDGGVATVETSKFVMIPDGQELDVKVNLLRDLSDGSAVIPGHIGSITHERFDAGSPKAKRLNMRKMRTITNLMTSRIGGADEETPDAVIQMLRPWYDMAKQKMNDLPKRGGHDEDLYNLVIAVNGGLQLCETVLEEDKEMSVDSRRRKMRAAHTNFSVLSGQLHNTKAAKKMRDSDDEEMSTRSTRQMHQRYVD